MTETASTTQTRTVKTSELQVGDTVRHYGMRIRIDAVHPYDGGNGLTAYSCPGTVLNIAEVRAADYVPMSFLRCSIHPGGACWHVQGNDLARWAVEIPAEDAAPAQFRSDGKRFDGQGRHVGPGDWLDVIHEVNKIGQEENPQAGLVMGEPESSGKWWAGGYAEEYADFRVLHRTDDSVSVISKTRRGADLLRRAVERKGWSVA